MDSDTAPELYTIRGEAENHIKKAINCKPDNPDYHYLLGFTYFLQSQWGNAIGEMASIPFAQLQRRPSGLSYLLVYNLTRHPSVQFGRRAI